MARIAIMALEGVDIEVPASGTDLPINGIDDELMEATEISTDINNNNDSIDEAVETTQVLESISIEMGKSIDKGGLSPDAAKMISIAVEHLYKRIGMKRINTGFVLEAFNDKTTKIQATKIAMETIAETAKKVWQAILAALSKAIEWVKNFYFQIMHSVEKYQALAEKVIAAADKAKGVESVSNKDDWNKYLRKDNKQLEGDEVAGAYKEFVAHLDKMQLSKNIIQYTDKAKNIIARNYTDSHSLIGEASKHLDYSVLFLQGNQIKTETGDLRQSEVKLAIGDTSIYATNVKSSETDDGWINYVNKARVWIDKSSDYADAPAQEERRAMSPNVVKDLATAVNNHLKAFSNVKSDINKINENQKNIMSAAASKAKVTSEDPDKAKAIKATQALIKNTIGLSTNTITAIHRHDIMVTKAILGYCSKCIGSSQEAKEGEPEKK